MEGWISSKLLETNMCKLKALESLGQDWQEKIDIHFEVEIAPKMMRSYIHKQKCHCYTYPNRKFYAYRIVSYMHKISFSMNVAEEKKNVLKTLQVLLW